MRKPDLRRFALLGVFSLLTSHFSLSAAMAADKRPNVLLIVGDDHRADVIGSYGSKLAKTPNLDRLAAQGMRFDRAYVNAPICDPSRQSFLTGRYPHCTGVSLHTQPLGKDAYTLAHRLREAGYHTGAFGKMNFNAPGSFGFEVDIDEKSYRQADAKREHRPLPEGMEVLPQWKPFHDPARIWLNGFYRPFGRFADEMAATFYADRAIDFMTEHKEEPWFVEIGFHEPHSPFQFPVGFAHLYRPQDMPVPEQGPEDAGGIPKVFVDLTRADKQGIIASYYTSVAWLDTRVGRVLDALERLHLAGDTLVIYIADNGYHLGEHGRFEKHTLFERCVRVPFIVRFPGRIRTGASTGAFVELVDLAPTVLDYLQVPHRADAPPPRDLHGQSLKPLIEGQTASVRDAVFSEYQQTQEAMVRTDQYKLIYQTSKAPDLIWIGYEPVVPPKGRSVRLYDELKDPQEFHNIAREPGREKVVSELLDRLADWYKRYPPVGDPPPPDLSREDFLDWAIAPRNPR